MDLTMTYELKSDIPTAFFSNIFLNATAEALVNAQVASCRPDPALQELFNPPWLPVEKRIPKIGFMYSNCNTRPDPSVNIAMPLTRSLHQDPEE